MKQIHPSTRSRCLAIVAGISLVFISACSSSGGSAKDGDASSYPERDISFVIPYSPGGSTDPLGRTVATALEGQLGVSIVPENVPGAAGTVGTQQAVTAKADGYTLGLTNAPVLVVAPKDNPDLKYRDFDDWSTPAKLGSINYYLVVKKDARWATAQEFLDEASAKKASISIGSSGGGNVSDFLTDKLNADTNGGFRAVPFEGGGEAFTAVLGGQADASISSPSTIAGSLESGDVRALAVFAEESQTFQPDVPPISDFGIDAAIGNSYYVIAPPGIPDDVYDVLVKALEKAITGSTQLADLLEGSGITPDYLFGDEATDSLKQESSVYETILSP